MQFFLKPAFGLSLVLAFMAVVTMAVPVNEATAVSTLMGGLDRSGDGVVVLCGDGVVRSITHNLTVLAYKKLDTQQIQHVINHFGGDDKLTKIYDGVNGNDVTDLKQLYYPPADILPASLASGLKTKRDAPAPNFQPPDCNDEKCYSDANCSQTCAGCFSPFPGFRGNCLNK